MKGIIVAVRKRDHSGPASGAVEAPCPACHEPVLLSRASQQRIRERGDVAYCAFCACKVIAKRGKGGVSFELPTAAEMADACGFTESN